MTDLRNRLLLLLVLPLCVLALVGVWMDYRSADDAASRHDQRLLRLLPALARWWRPIHEHGAPLLLLAPPVKIFCARTPGSRATACVTLMASCCWGMSGWMAWCPPPRSLNSTAWNMAA
jgi:hypothetical protein